MLCWVWLLGPAQAQPASLQTYMEAAVRHDPRTAIARAREDSARAEAADAGAALLPTVRGQAGWSYNQHEAVATFPSFDGGPPEEFVIVPHQQLQASLNLRAPLLDAPAWATWRGQRVGVDTAAHDAFAVEQDLRLELARAWYGAAAATEIVEAAARTRAAAAENVRYLTLRADAGAATALSVQRAQLELANAELLVIDAERSTQNALRALSTLSRLEAPATMPPIAVDLSPPDPEASLLSAARTSRPEVVAAQAELRRTRLARSGAWLGYTPTVAATASEQYTNASGFSGENTAWRVGVELDWLLLEFGDRSSDVRRARAALAVREATLRQTLDAVRDEVQGALLDVQSARARVEAARVGAEVGQAAAAEAAIRFKAGTATQVEVIQTERDALDAQVKRIQAAGELAIARLALQRATGQRVRAP